VLEHTKHFANIFHLVRNLQKPNGIRISKLAGRGKPGRLSHNRAVANRRSHSSPPNNVRSSSSRSGRATDQLITLGGEPKVIARA
jgi:hypothetical protein